MEAGKQPEKTRNKGGRPKGSQNRLTMTVKECFEQVFKDLQQDPDNPANLQNFAKTNPADFYRIAAKLIPQATTAEITGANGGPIQHGLKIEFVGKGS